MPESQSGCIPFFAGWKAGLEPTLDFSSKLSQSGTWTSITFQLAVVSWSINPFGISIKRKRIGDALYWGHINRWSQENRFSTDFQKLWNSHQFIFFIFLNGQNQMGDKSRHSFHKFTKNPNPAELAKIRVQTLSASLVLGKPTSGMTRFLESPETVSGLASEFNPLWGILDVLDDNSVSI